MRGLTWATGATVVAVVLAGCQSSGPAGPRATGAAPGATTSPGAPASEPGGTPSPSEVPAPRVTIAPADEATKVRPDATVTVRAENGRLGAVTVTDDTGAQVPGEAAGDVEWRTVPGALKGATRYTVTVGTVGSDGSTSTRRSTFRTLTPAATNRAVLLPGDDWDVGVGMPVIVRFASPVRNRGKVVDALTVTSTPGVTGSWRWMSDQEVHYRPSTYWPAGAKVSVRAALGGVETSKGVWGKRTVTTAFAVGAAQVSTVDVARHTMTVRRNGKVIRTIPVTTGKKGFQTRAGVKVVMSREAEVNMDAATTGTDPKDPEYYNLQVKWALRLTYSGEFLHAAPWSVRSQGKANVSHGCTGMSTANAKWLYDNSKVGDVVEFVRSPRPLEWGNGYTVWNKPYSAWRSGA